MMKTAFHFTASGLHRPFLPANRALPALEVNRMQAPRGGPAPKGKLSDSA